MKKRYLAIGLVICLLLVGCSAAGGDPAASGAASASTKPDASDSASLQYAYTAEYLPVELQMDGFNYSCINGNTLYMIGSDYSDSVDEDGNYEYSEETFLATVDLTTGEAKKLDWYTPIEIPEGFEGGSYVNYMTVADDGSIWIADNANTYSFDLPADFNAETDNQYDYYVEGETICRVVHYGADGSVLSEMTMPEVEGSEGSFLYVNVIDEKGNIFATDYQKTYVLDETGKIVKEYSTEMSSLTNFCGQAALQTYDETQKFQLIDPETLELGESMTMPVNGWSYLPSYDPDYDFYYDNDGTVYGFDQDTGASVKVLAWMDWDIDPNTVNSTYTMQDGRFVGFINEWDDKTGEASYQIVMMTSVDPASLPEKTVLTLACMYLDYNLRQEIVKFNKAHDNVRIVVNDYSQYATAEDYNAGVTKLNTEILSGKVPDLLLSGSMPIEQYASKGILEDLTGYIENDPELGMDDLMSGVMDAASIDGKLYQTFGSFTIETCAANKRVADHFDTWTVRDVKEALSMLREDATIFGVGYTRDSVLQNCVGQSLSRFVNWQTGECSFDSDEFKDLLAFANEFPETFDWESYDWNDYVDGNTAVCSGSQLMTEFYVYSLDDYMYILASLQDSCAFVGFPSATGEGSRFRVNSGICITSACADKDAAWEFARTVLCEDYQNDHIWNGLPTNANVFNKQIEDIMTPDYELDENGEPVVDENGVQVAIPKYTYGTESGEIVVEAMTQEQYDQLMELIGSIHTVGSSNDALYGIVTEEAGAYFAGQKSIDEVADMINSRVSLIVAEQR